MKKNSVKYRTELILFSLSCVSILIAAVLNYGNARIRIVEIRNLLSESIISSQDIDHAGLITHYRFRMDLYNKKITDLEADIIEMKALSMFPVATGPEDIEKEGCAARISAAVANTFKRIIGKPPVVLNPAKRGNSALFSAYFYERNSLFEKALEQYDKTLEQNPRSDQKGGIILHQGFCLSMIGRTDDAMEKYLYVIEHYPNEPVSVTASVLIEFLKKFSSEADAVKKMPDSHIKMEKLFRLIAFNDSLHVLENIKAKKNSGRNIAMLFFEARCLESTGKTSEALEIYQDILMRSPSSEQAKYANRRIIMISLKSGLADEGKQLADRNNYIIRDNSFEYFVKEISRIESLFLRVPETSAVFYRDGVRSAISDSEKESAQLKLFMGKKVKVITVNGDIIIGKTVFEDKSKIKVSTIAGDAVIMKRDIKKSEFR